jgi:hypothetical protein
MKLKNNSYCLFLMIFLFTGAAFPQQFIRPGGSDKTLEAYETYSGTTSTGQRIHLSLKEEGSRFIGHGTIGAKKFNVSGLTVWRGIASMVDSKGEIVRLDIEMTPNKNFLTLRGLEESVDLSRTSLITPTLTPGSLSGVYETEDVSELKMAVEILHVDDRIYGTAKVMGDEVAVVGYLKTLGLAERLKMPGVAKGKKVEDKFSLQFISGMLLYRDNIQQKFTANISKDKKAITFTGIGGTVTLKKKEGSVK